MNNYQLYIAVAIPSVLVILSWIQSIARLSRLEANFDAFQRDIRQEVRAESKQVRDELRGEIRELRDELYGVRDELRGEIREVRGEVVALRDIVYREMVTLHERVATVETRTK